MYTVVSDLSSIDDFQLHLNSINTWSILWQLPIAHSKCTLFHIGSRYNPSPNHSFTLGNTPLLKSDTVTDLGILFDDTLKFQNHIHIISRRAHLRANLIHRCFYSKNPTLLVRAYKVYVRPLLEYNPFIWSPSLIGLINTVENVQRHFTKRIPGLHSLSYAERLYNLKLQSLEHRRLICDLIYCFRIVHFTLYIVNFRI